MLYPARTYEEDVSPEMSETKPDRGRRGCAPAEPTTPTRILIIDDDRQLGRVLKEYFARNGIEAFVFEAPPDIASTIESVQPDSVLLDVVLREAFGLDVLSEIKEVAPQLPVIMMTGFTDYEKNIESLRKGAYAFFNKPFPSIEEVYHSTKNAVSYHQELRRTRHLTEEIERKLHSERLNLLELDFLKSLNRLIGETEDPATVLRSSFSLLTSFLSFDAFAALVHDTNEVAIHVYSNVALESEDTEMISKTLTNRMGEAIGEGTETRILLNLESEGAKSPGAKTFCAIVSSLSPRSRARGHTALFRTTPFDPDDEATFKRFSSHISSTLEKIALFQEIKSLSIHDALTGLFNHGFMLTKLDEEVERAKRYDAHFSIALFDVDDFKKVNDTHGHLAGDAVLKRLGELFRAGMRGIDTAGRYGGEEFLVILPETGGERAYLTAERLRAEIAAGVFTYGDAKIRVSVTGGVASYCDGANATTLLKAADNNLYKAKAQGKNRIGL